MFDLFCGFLFSCRLSADRESSCAYSIFPCFVRRFSPYFHRTTAQTVDEHRLASISALFRTFYILFRYFRSIFVKTSSLLRSFDVNLVSYTPRPTHTKPAVCRRVPVTICRSARFSGWLPLLRVPSTQGRLN